MARALTFLLLLLAFTAPAQLVSGVLARGQLFAFTTNQPPPTYPCTLWRDQLVSYGDNRAIANTPMQLMHNTNGVARTVCKLKFYFGYASGNAAYAQVMATDGTTQIGGNSDSVTPTSGAWAEFTFTTDKPIITASTDFFIRPRMFNAGVAGDVVVAGNGYDDDSTYVLYSGGSPVAAEDLMFEMHLEDVP